MKNVKPKDIQKEWHLIDARNQVLGRISSEIAKKLMGKNKSYYTPYLDTGDYVVVINAKDVFLTGKKENQKNYFRHSGYPGGLRVRTVAQTRSQQPEELIRHAIIGMLPKTKLARQMLKKLYVFPESSHPFKDKFENHQH